jgi:hypothetical protein
MKRAHEVGKKSLNKKVIRIALPRVGNIFIIVIKRSLIDSYRVSQEKRSIFLEVIVSVILIKDCICTCVLFITVSEIELFHCTDEQHTISSHELQSALMFTVEFSKMYRDMTSESRNSGTRTDVHSYPTAGQTLVFAASNRRGSPLLANGSLTHVSVAAE